MLPITQKKLNTALDFYRSGRIHEADHLAQEVLTANPDLSDALHLRGVIAGLQERHADAEYFLKKAQMIDKTNHFIYFNLAKSISEQGRNRESLKWYKKALNLDVNHDKAWLNYGIALFKSSNIDGAISAFDRALTINVSMSEAYSNKANCLIFK